MNAELVFAFPKGDFAIFRIKPPPSCCPVPYLTVFSKKTADDNLGRMTDEELNTYYNEFSNLNILLSERKKHHWIELHPRPPSQAVLDDMQRVIEEILNNQ